jgi:TolB-like protein
MVVDLQQLKASLADRYVIEREVGRGGMATVYLAQDLKHGRVVAIKVLRSDLSDGVAADRFHQEIEIAARLQHPRILPLHDSGTAGSLLYYTMPFVEGESLSARLKRETPLPLGEALEITRQVGQALVYAHEQGIVHRDIKPGNILLSSGGAVLADFGIASALHRAGGEVVTETGVAIGTPNYMSPEQASGEKVTRKSDQYSLACVLYEMLTGQPPFTGSAQVVSMRHQFDPVLPIATARSTVPSGIEEAVLRGLEKVPADRFRSMEDFLAAIREGETTEPGLTDVRGPAALKGRSSRRRTLVGAAVTIAAVVAAIAFWPSGPASADPLDRTRVAVLYFDDVSLTGDLEYLADGITETLIFELAGPLRVINRNGVRPYREVDIPIDSLARLLNVGSVVDGTVERSRDSLVARVTVVDGNTGFAVRSERLARAGSDPVQLRDEIVREAKRMLNREVGLALREEATRATTDSNEAWRLFQQAQRLREDADEARWALNDPDEATALLVAVDSLLARAETSDPDWIEPIIERGWAAALRGALASTGGRSSWDEAALREGIAHADRVLERDAGSPGALELRGSALYDLTWLNEIATDSIEVGRLREQAEVDLLAATRADSTRARAWVALAQLRRSGGEFAQASIAAQRALEADPFLVNAESLILLAMTQVFLDLRDMESAKQWNEEALRRYPLQGQFGAGHLVMMAGWPGWENAVDTAWAMTNHPGLKSWLPRRLMVAAVLAREGLADSARALIADVRAEGSDNSFLNYYEAQVRIQLGEPDEAIRLLDLWLAANPGRRSYIAEDWWWESLRGDPRFRALVATDE